MDERLKILCVDDEPIVLDGLRTQVFRNFREYAIEAAESGEEAMEILTGWYEDKQEVIVVLVDHIMPGIKGDELLTKAHEMFPRAKKIMLTGQADLVAVTNAVNNAGLYRYLSKPWQEDDLTLTIKEALKSYYQSVELERKNQELEERVRQRTQELSEKNVELSEKNMQLIQLNQEKNEFLSIAAHDLKNPLSIIRGYAELIHSQQEHLNKEMTTNLAHQIDRSALRMFHLIKDLLDVNAIESGKINLTPEEFDLRIITSAVVESYQMNAAPKSITLHYLIPANFEGMVYVDRHKLHEILDNLVSNAIKYSPPNRNVYVRLSTIRDFCRCEIQDEGPGFKPEDKEKLFQKFSRLSAKPTGNEHSSGLGLFIVKKLADAMQCQVRCEGEPGLGATFILEVPTKAAISGQPSLADKPGNTK